MNEIIPWRAGSSTRALLAQHPDGVPATPTYRTGLMALDYVLNGGLRAGEMTVIGAPTGHGKSALAEQVALEISKQWPTQLFALELGRAKTERRLLAKIAGTDLRSIDTLITERPDKIEQYIDELTYRRCLYIEERDVEASYVFNDLAAHVLDQAPRVIIIDHPRHLDDWNGEGYNRFAAAELLSRRFRGMASITGAHVIVVAQTKTRLGGKKPLKEDLADTYALAQVADCVIMVHRPHRGQGHKDVVAELIVDKNRNGPEGIAHTRWRGPSMSYSDLTPSEERELECCKPRRRKAEAAAADVAPPFDQPHDADESIDLGDSPFSFG